MMIPWLWLCAPCAVFQLHWISFLRSYLLPFWWGSAILLDPVQMCTGLNQMKITLVFLFFFLNFICLSAEIERGIQVLEMRCYRTLLNISYKTMCRTGRFATESGLQLECIIWSPNQFKEKETQMVWPHIKILGHVEDNTAGHSERSKKERKTEEEMGR